MQVEGIQPDSVTYNTAAHALCKDQDQQLGWSNTLAIVISTPRKIVQKFQAYQGHGTDEMEVWSPHVARTEWGRVEVVRWQMTLQLLHDSAKAGVVCENLRPHETGVISDSCNPG